MASPCRSVTSRRRQDSPTTNAASGASGEQERLTAVWACVYLYYQLKVKMIGGPPPRVRRSTTTERFVGRRACRPVPVGSRPDPLSCGKTPPRVSTSRVHRCYLMIIQTRSCNQLLVLPPLQLPGCLTASSVLDAIVPQALTAVTIHMGSPSVGCGLTSAPVTFCHPATGPK